MLAQYTNVLCTVDDAEESSGKWLHRLNYEVPEDTVVGVRITCYLQSGKDSTRLYDLHFDAVKLLKGSGFKELYFNQSDAATQPDPTYMDILKRFHTQPSGQYTIQLQLQAKDAATPYYSRRMLQQVDTNLSYSSGLRSRINGLLTSGKKAAAAKSKSLPGGKKVLTETERKKGEQQAQGKLSRHMRSLKGVETRAETVNGSSYTYLYYKNYVLGRYELAPVKELEARATAENSLLSTNASSKVDNELEGFKSVRSQVKELYQVNDKDSRMRGQLDISTTKSTAQDPNSAVSPDYTELMGNIDFELMGLPVSMEGYYTTQDNDRVAKASYLRLHYDVATAKDKLQKIISGYKTKMEETIAKGQGLDQVYSSYTQNLDNQKSALLRDMAREYQVNPKLLTSGNNNLQRITDSLSAVATDTARILNANGKKDDADKVLAKAEERKAKVEKNRKNLEERYQQLEALEQKINKYSTLLEQYRDHNRLDSTLNYAKVKALNGDEASYKDIAKAAGGLLPEGKAKSFVAGLTNMDIGIINKYESDYTMAGQTLKGISLGYDLGAVKAGITAGNTEYVSRDGNLDRYSSILLRLDSKGLKQHKIGLVYNGNTPSKSMLRDDQFKGASQLAYPSFTAPVHIVSLLYDATLVKTLMLHSEVAGSFKNGRPGSPDMEHSAINTAAEYLIPKTGISLKGEWEHLGAGFENNALPYIRTATERYTVGTGLDLFRSFLNLNIEYNSLAQKSFSGTGYSRKWGFDIKTHSRRYPNISLSYKPFSTFRSYTDTMNIPQRPMYGSVWTGRSSYQFKRNKKVHRFTLVYSQNTSISDSAQYHSATTQLGYTFNSGPLALNAGVGRIELPANYSNGDGMISSYQVNAGVSHQLSPSLQLSLAPDVSFCNWGLQRLSATAGCVYRLQKQKMALRLLLRYSGYTLEQGAPTTTVYSGQMGVNWQFQSKSRHRQNDIK